MLNVNLKMSGELEELNNVFVEHEKVIFKMQDFENTQDENVKVIKQFVIRIGKNLQH